MLRLLITLIATTCAATEPIIQSIDHVVLRTVDGSREVDNLVFYPDGAERCPVVVFSHDLGRSRSAYWYLGEAWARAGIVVVFPTHSSSDREAFAKVGLFEAAATAVRAAQDPAIWTARADDLAAVVAGLDQLEIQAPALRGRVRHEAIGVAGHGFGALTAAAAAGLCPQLAGARATNLSQPAFRAGLLLGPPGCWPVADAEAWQHVGLPMFIASGDQDRDLAAACGVPDTTGWQLNMCDHLKVAVTILHLPEAHHWTWSNGGWGPRVDPAHVAAISAATMTFWQHEFAVSAPDPQPGRLSAAP